MLALTGQFPPVLGDPLWAWAVWLASLTAGLFLFVLGVLGSIRWGIERGLVSWSKLKRLRVVLMFEDGSPRARSIFAFGKDVATISVAGMQSKDATPEAAPVPVRTTTVQKSDTPFLTAVEDVASAVGGHDDPPSADDLKLRPPRSKNVPRDVWIEAQRETWCKARASLITDGHVLLRELQAVPFDAPTSENDKFHPRVTHWENAFIALVRTYWDDNNPQAIVGVARSAGSTYESTAVGPDWAGTKAGLIGSPLAWLESQPSDCPPVITPPARPAKKPVLVLTTDRSNKRRDDADAARAELSDLADQGDEYAEKLRALDLDPDDDGYDPEDEKLVKDAEAWCEVSEDSEDYWFPSTGGFFGSSLATMASLNKALGMVGDPTTPVRRPVWRQHLVLRVEARVKSLRARLK